MLGWFRRRRRRAGLSGIILVVGALSCVCTLPMLFFGVPASWLHAREVASLPYLTPPTLDTLEPGTQALFSARIPTDAPVETHGLALWYGESRRAPGSSSEQDSSAGASSWQRDQPPPQRFKLLLANDEPLMVQFAPTVTFGNAQRIEQEASESPDAAENERDYRYTGYLPGQVLTIEGTWEGAGLVTARACYAGSPDDYRDYVASRPGMLLLSGIFCGVVGAILLASGAALRLLGR